jgi:chorismate mutase
MLQQLEDLRDKLAKLDNILIQLLKARQDYSKQIAVLKHNQKLPLQDLTQEAKQFTQYQKLAIKYNLNIEFIKQLFTVIIAESKRIQQHNNEQ